MRIEPDHDLLGVGVHERFAIPQRALLVPSADAGNVLWDCTSVVTADAVDRLNDAGGVDMIAISHPHFYASMVEWSDAFGGVPILVHAADEEWISRRSPAVRTWDGDRLDAVADRHPAAPAGPLPGQRRPATGPRRRAVAPSCWPATRCTSPATGATSR